MKNNKKIVRPHWDVCNPKSAKHKNVFPADDNRMEEFLEKYPVVLSCKAVLFDSYLDEGLFFAWIRQIPAIKAFEGLHENVNLFLGSSDISKTDLCEIIALFDRYKIEMTQLQIFMNEKNKKWFYANKKAYWHKKVFKCILKKSEIH